MAAVDPNAIAYLPNTLNLRANTLTAHGRTLHRLVMEGTHVGTPRRVGVVLEVHGKDGAPPYRVRWLDSGHETLCFPGPDAHVQPEAETKA